MFDFPFMHVEDYGRSHEFRSLNGRVRVPFRWEPPHSVSGQGHVSLVVPDGAFFGVARSSGARVQAFPVKAVTQGDDTAKLLALLKSEVTVGLVHSSWVCRAKGCQIPEFQIIHVTGYPRETTGHTRIQTYEWDLSCVPADPAQVGEVPTRTWGDLEAAHSTWGDAESAYGTWADAEETA